MQVGMLGPLRVVAGGGAEVPLGGTRLRAVLARLALEPGRVVPASTLIDDLWGEEPPSDAGNALQSLVSRLRRALRPAGDGLVESRAAGYRLAVAEDDVDVFRFERMVAEGRAAARAGRAAEAAAALRAALGLWRGQALAGVADAPFTAGAVARLAELRTAALEDRIEADIHAGGHADVVAELRTLVAEQPLRERAAGLLVRALAMAGRQAEAMAAYERVRRDLDDQLGVAPSAELRELHLALLRGQVRPAQARRPRRAPVPLTSFIGRRAELAEARRLLDRGRLVTLVGPGGAGKTRLATELAATRSEPAWFVELAGVGAAENLPAAVLASLGGPHGRLLDGASGPPRSGAALERVVEELSGHPCLLVLDNCEHVVEAAAELAGAVLARCPDLRVMATSREPLAITGEAVLAVGPLGLPPPGASVADLAEAEAVRLFADRAAAASPGFRVDGATAADVVEVCRRLDGLPLALELAAARLRSMTVRQVAERLDDRFRLLTGGNRTALPRHRTLRAVVEWSWDLLEEPERLLAARLSVFAAGGQADAVAAVAADERLPADDVVYVLASLVEKSLVTVAEGRDGQVRYRMLETVRAYAAERLAESGGTGRVRLALARHFLGLLTEAEPAMRGADQVRWLDRLAADQGNLVAAVHYAAAAGEAELACLLTARACWFWVLSGSHEEALQLAQLALGVPGDAPDHLRATLRAFASLGDFTFTPERSVLRAVTAELASADAMAHHPIMAMLEPMLATFAGEPELARARLRRAAELPDPWGRAAAMLGTALLAANDGDVAAAEEHAERALAAFARLGDRWGQAMAIGQLSEQRSLRGDHAGAIAAYEVAVRLADELGATDEVSGTLARLSVLRARSGDLDGAARDLRVAMAQATARGVREMAALCLVWLADVERRRGDLPAAARLLVEAHAAQEETRHLSPQWAAITRATQALIDTARGDPEGAVAQLRLAWAAISEVPDMPIIAQIAEAAASAADAAGRPEAAARLVGVAAAIRGAPDLGNTDLDALLARIDARIGEPARVAAHDAGRALDQAGALAELERFLAP